MPPRRALVIGALLAATIAGCGSDSDSMRAPATATTAALPALAGTPAKPGELLFSGQTSPASHGPFSLDGRYVVRFEQFAPEDPKLDFSGQTPFTALLRPAGSRSEGTELFSSASPSGKTEVTRDGRYELEVTFGDFPYAVRLTPRR